MKITRTGLAALSFSATSVILWQACGTGVFNVDGSSAASPAASATPSPSASVSTSTVKYYLVALDTTNALLRSYSIDGTTGALSAAGSDIASVGSYVTAVSPNGKYVFTTGADKVSSYTLNASTGTLALVNTVTLPSANATYVSVHPTGSFIYVSDGTTPTGKIFVLSVNSTTGTIASTSNTTTGGLDYPHCVIVNPAGTFAYAADYAGGLGTGDKISAFSINSSTGALTALGSSPFAGTNTHVNDPRNLAIDAAGKYLYVVDESSNPTLTSHFSINSSTGALSVVGHANPGAATAGGGIGITPDSKFLYSTNRGENTLSVFSLNSSTGAPTFSTTSGSGGTAPVSIAIHPTANFLYVGHQNDAKIAAFSFSASTGGLTALSPATYALPTGGATSGYVAIARVTAP